MNELEPTVTESEFQKHVAYTAQELLKDLPVSGEPTDPDGEVNPDFFTDIRNDWSPELQYEVSALVYLSDDHLEPGDWLLLQQHDSHKWATHTVELVSLKARLKFKNAVIKEAKQRL